MQEQEPAGICDEMWARKPFGISILVVMPRRGILLQSLFVSTKKSKQDFHKVVVRKVDPWTNEDGPDFPLDASGPGQAFPRGSVDLSFQQVFMVDQDDPSSSARNTQLVVMLEPAKDVGKRLQGKRMMASSDVNAKEGPFLKRAKICSVAKLRDLHSTMQGGDAPVNASNAQAQAKRDQLTSGLTPTYADIAAGRPALPGNQTKQRRNLPGKQSQTEMFTGIPQGLPNYDNNCHVNGLVQAINAAMPVLPVREDPLFKNVHFCASATRKSKPPIKHYCKCCGRSG
eukprot:g29450.t1